MGTNAMGMEKPARTPPTPVVGLWRYIFIAAGFASLGMAYLGALLPGLPTTPWVLLASYCFTRSSPRLQHWLLRSPIFGRLLHDWHTHRGIRKPVKIVAVTMMLAACTFSVGFAGLPHWLRIVIACCGVVGLCVVLFVVPTVRDGACSTADDVRKY